MTLCHFVLIYGRKYGRKRKPELNNAPLDFLLQISITL